MAKKTGRKQNAGMDARDLSVISKAASGKKPKDIANEYGLSTRHIHRILKSDEAKALVAQCRSALMEIGSLAVQTLKDAMENRADNMAVAVKAAERVLSGIGALEPAENKEAAKLFIYKDTFGEIRTGSGKPAGNDEEE